MPSLSTIRGLAHALRDRVNARARPGALGCHFEVANRRSREGDDPVDTAVRAFEAPYLVTTERTSVRYNQSNYADARHR
jgi:hypothetical protein